MSDPARTPMKIRLERQAVSDRETGPDRPDC